MKRILFFLFSCTVGLYSCKKDGTTTPTPDQPDTTIIPVYADSLSAGIKVGYGTNVTGTFPTSTSSAPVLDSVHTQVYKIAKGHYLIVQPKVLSGTIAGYYIQIPGAASYFKVDYAQAYNLRKGSPHKGLRAAGGIADSTIVIKLPETVKGDTFHVRYAAYDAQNHVSNVVTEKAQIVTDSSAPVTDSLFAKWRYYGDRHTLNGQFTEDDWSSDTLHVSYYEYFNCVNNQLVYSYDPTSVHLPVVAYNLHETLTFATSTCTGKYLEYKLVLDSLASSCSNFIFTTTVYADEEPMVSDVSYDAAARKLVIIYDPAKSDLGTVTYTINELTATTLVLTYPVDERDNPSSNSSRIRYIKLLKE